MSVLHNFWLRATDWKSRSNWTLLFVTLVASVFSSVLFSSNIPASAVVLRCAIALLPVIPGIVLLFGAIRSYREQDELERKIVAESFMFSCGATAIVALAYGQFQRYLGAPAVSGFWVAALLLATWIVGRAMARSRYE